MATAEQQALPTTAGPIVIEFKIVGEPKPAGSKISQVIYGRDGKPVMKNGRVVSVVRHDNPDTAKWMAEVRQQARKHYSGGLLIGAVRFSLVFVRPHGKGDFGSGKNAGVLKAGAPRWPTKRPDVLKLARAVEDALTNVIWCDDSQIVEEHLTKCFGSYAAVWVKIESLDGLVSEAF